tara:strand:- start:8247 stop:9194 length:948 start_codon:yes stop_codon:yes gene_type:complete
MNDESYNNIIQKNFKNIIYDNDELLKMFNFIINYDNNILLYSIHGFPLDFMIDEILKEKYKLKTLIKKEVLWDKSVTYLENQYFFEINLMNPSLPKDYSFLTKFILYILKNKNLNSSKHLIIIKHIDVMREYFSVLKILLESFSDNAFFICTTYSISGIEDPIISRFTSFKIRLFLNSEIQDIFNKYLNKPLNKHLIINQNRNLIFSLFIADVEINEPDLITKEFCTFNFPPLYDFIRNFNKKNYNLENIRNFSYNCFQYNIKLGDIILDVLKIPNFKKKFEIIQIGADLEHKLVTTNKGREPIYIETLLCFILL